MTAIRWGNGLIVAGAATLTVAILGMLPWVAGEDVDCAQAGPHRFFLLAWPAGPALAFAGAAVLLRIPKQAPRLALRRAATLVGFGVVPLAAAVWWVVVVADGVKECGF